jgi:hypothetical protein
MSSENEDSSNPTANDHVGSGEYEVRPGDCMASIAHERGFFWKTLWEHPINSEIRRERKDPNALLPGDRVHIPELGQKNQECATDQRHTFVLQGEPCEFKLTLMDYDRPYANEPYRLTVDGVFFNGVLDGNGTLAIKIPGNAQTGTLFVGTPPLEERFDLELGEMDPIQSLSGIRKRLENLGFECGGEEELGPQTTGALADFQKANHLTVTGELDDDTRQMLEQQHLSTS